MATIQALLGGLGLFLLGMVLLTDGLKALAGDALRTILMRFVGGPWSGLVSGALVTALVQSSTATTVASIGFVSAGMLTFREALGVIFGANLGTTSTGWIVSILGFKVSLGGMSGFLVLLGVVLRLVVRGRLSHLGTVFAGFGLLFLGIDMLQRSMAGVSERIDLTAIAGTGMSASLVMVGIGAVMTMIVQSSSAAMATTLAAVAAGAITIEQGAALVIGQNVGTTLTAAIAGIAAPTAARRTALAHILFNVITGLVALLLMRWLLAVVESVVGDAAAHAAVVLAGFHTAFNLLGVLLLPALRPFAWLIEKLVPERGAGASRFLGRAVASLGPVAQEAVRRALLELRAEAAGAGGELMAAGRLSARSIARFDLCATGIGEVRDFLDRLGEAEQSPRERDRHVSLLHATDHLRWLLRVLRAPPSELPRRDAAAGTVLAEPMRRLGDAFASAADAQREAGAVGTGELSQWLADLRRSERRVSLEMAADRRLDTRTALIRIELLIWLDQLAYHLWRASHHLQAPARAATEPAAGEDSGVRR